MAFTKEVIKTDEQKKFFESFGFCDYRGEKLNVGRWYVDNTNKFYFVVMGGGSFEIPYTYGLMTPQGFIVIERHTPNKFVRSDEKENVFYVHWNIDKILYPPNMQYTCDEITTLVTEAIMCFESEDGSETKKYIAVIDSIATPQIYTEWEEIHYSRLGRGCQEKNICNKAGDML